MTIKIKQFRNISVFNSRHVHRKLVNSRLPVTTSYHYIIIHWPCEYLVFKHWFSAIEAIERLPCYTNSIFRLAHGEVNPTMVWPGVSIHPLWRGDPLQTGVLAPPRLHSWRALSLVIAWGKGMFGCKRHFFWILHVQAPHTYTQTHNA